MDHPHKTIQTVIWPKPEPCRVSYWVGASRDELRTAVAQQRNRQQIPTVKEITFDPALAATVSLQAHKAEARLRRELGR